MILVIASLSARLHHGELRPRSGVSVALLLRVIWTGQILFATTCGNGGYARSIDALSTPPPGSSDGFLESESLDRLGRDYVLTLTASASWGPIDCLGRSTATSFSVSAVPKVFGETGRRSFTLAADGVIWYSESAVAPTAPFQLTGKRMN